MAVSAGRASDKQLDPIARLSLLLARLPGVGEKTAQRLAFHILESPREYARELSQALLALEHEVRLCSRCCNLTAQDPCALCRDPQRDGTKLCVVETVPDLLAIERTHEYRGRYHVLHGALSPLDGIGPERLKIKELLARLHPGSGAPSAARESAPQQTGAAGDAQSGPSDSSRAEADPEHAGAHPEIDEIILATDPTVEGEATALYLARLLKPLGLRLTRIAQGVPMGGDLEYADQVTLARALSGRREL